VVLCGVIRRVPRQEIKADEVIVPSIVEIVVGMALSSVQQRVPARLLLSYLLNDVYTRPGR
jgi:hypothetical protein